MKNVTTMLTLFTAASLMLGGTVYASDQTEAGAEISFTDTQGNNFELDAVPEKIVVINRYNTELLRACGLEDKIVGVDGSIVENSTYWPEFTEENNIGGNGQNAQDVDYEVIAGMEPDIILTRDRNDEIVAAMESFDIPVVYLDGASPDALPQVEVLKEIFGETEKMKEFETAYTEAEAAIEAVVKDIPDDERKTFVWESVKDYNVSGDDNVFAKMAARAGLKNALADTAFDMNEVDADAVITADPDMIFKLITPAAVDTSGYTVPTAEDFTLAKEAFSGRPGFDHVKAVENQDVYFISSFGVGGFGKLVGSAYLAKWAYPEQASDLDADEILRSWLEDFQGVTFANGYFAKISDINE